MAHRHAIARLLAAIGAVTIGAVTIGACALVRMRQTERSAPGYARAGGAVPALSFDASGPLEYSGRMDPADSGRVRVSLVLRNPGTTPVVIEHSACSTALWLHRDPTRRGPPVWDDRPPAGAVCLTIVYTVVVPPGGAREILAGHLTPARELADAVPPGLYFVTIVLKNARGELTQVAAGEVAIAR